MKLDYQKLVAIFQLNCILH